jgi:hypothetical protein
LKEKKMKNDRISELEGLRKQTINWSDMAGQLRAKVTDLEVEVARLKGVISEFGKGEGEAFRAATIAACDERIAAYKHEAREAKKRLEWQPIETAPMDKTKLFLFFDGEMAVGYYQEAWEKERSDGVMMSGTACWLAHDDNEGLTVVTPTHWQPLPPPPIEM